MNNKLGLFREAAKQFVRSRGAKRKLYTDSIYPYPFGYFNNKIYPSQVCYRETWPISERMLRSKRNGAYLMKIFWTLWWYSLFSDPGVILGHYHLPDPTMWTDAELGIPPDHYGRYDEWLDKTLAGN